jgi:hypothetical protein
MEQSQSGMSFERWNQPSPLKRMKVDGASMDAETNFEHTWSDDSYRGMVRSRKFLDSVHTSLFSELQLQ